MTFAILIVAYILVGCLACALEARFVGTLGNNALVLALWPIFIVLAVGVVVWAALMSLADFSSKLLKP